MGAIQLVICWVGAYSASCNAMCGMHSARAARKFRTGAVELGDVELEVAYVWARRGLLVPAMAWGLVQLHRLRGRRL